MINAWFKFEGLKLSRSQGITQMMTQTTTVPKTICLSTVGGDINIHVDLTSQSNHKQERLNATRERFLKRIRQKTPNLRKILSHDGLFNEIVIARHAQLNRFSR